MTTNLSPQVRIVIGSLLLLGLVLAVEYWIGWEAALTPWQTLQPAQTALAVVLVLCSYGIRTLRLIFFFPGRLKSFFGLSLKLMLIHNFWNNLLPMRTGEISFPILMQRYFSIKPDQSLPALFWFRLLDLYVVIMLAIVSLMLAGNSLVEVTLLAVFLTAAIPLTWKLLPAMLLRLENMKSTRISSISARIRQSLPDSWRLLATSTCWTLLNWTVKLAAFTWVLMQFAPVETGTALLGTIGGELTSVLPVHGVAGAGTYEAGVVVAMLAAGIDSEAALLAALNLHIFLLSCALLGGLIGLFLPVKSVADTALSSQDR